MTEPTILVPDAGRGKPSEGAAAPRTGANDFAERCVQTAGRIAELNSRAVSTTLDELRAIALEQARERSPFDAWRLNASYALAGTAKAAAYWRHVNEILLGAIVDAVADTESRVNRDFMSWSAAFGDAALGSTILTGDSAHALRSDARDQ